MKLVRMLRLLLAGVFLFLALAAGPGAWAQRPKYDRYGRLITEEKQAKESNGISVAVFLIIAAPTAFLVFRGIKKG